MAVFQKIREYFVPPPEFEPETIVPAALTDYEIRPLTETNFHLPQSSLLVLVSTFAGYNLTMKAYKHAARSKYRFYSYGDCMLIL